LVAGASGQSDQKTYADGKVLHASKAMRL
jgi:hypothetical protein